MAVALRERGDPDRVAQARGQAARGEHPVTRSPRGFGQELLELAGRENLRASTHRPSAVIANLVAHLAHNADRSVLGCQGPPLAVELQVQSPVEHFPALLKRRVKMLGQVRSRLKPAVHPQVLTLALERVRDVVDRIVDGRGRIVDGGGVHGAPIRLWLTGRCTDWVRRAGLTDHTHRSTLHAVHRAGVLSPGTDDLGQRAGGAAPIPLLAPVTIATLPSGRSAVLRADVMGSQARRGVSVCMAPIVCRPALGVVRPSARSVHVGSRIPGPSNTSGDVHGGGGRAVPSNGMQSAAAAAQHIRARRLLRDRGSWPLPRAADAALSAAVAVLQLGAAYAVARHHHPPHDLGAIDVLLLLAGPAALLAHRRHPAAVMWITFLAALGPRTDQFAYISLILSVSLAITNGHRRAGWVMLMAGYVASLWLAPLILGQPTTPPGEALAFAGWLTVLGVAAETVRIRRERMAAATAARAAEQRVRAGSQRMGIARELHDVVGHNISLINLQAGIGLDLFEKQPDQAREALASIREASSEALNELRAMLATLRDDEHEQSAPRAPSPGLEQLPELVEPARSAGLSVTVQRTGAARPLGGAVELAAYRIIQESLTNVARHAPGASVIIDLAYDSDRLSVTICDTGRQYDRLPKEPGCPLGNPGSGIAGMRGRAEALGGTLDARRRADGGFEVTAHLPAGVRR
jgi:signal transduction histidine kinase